MGRVERVFEDVTTTGDLRERHIEALTTDKYWRASAFSFPDSSSCLRRLNEMDLKLKYDGLDELERISSLREVFDNNDKSLEHVSMLLSFVDPTNYCIFSNYVSGNFFPLDIRGTWDETYVSFRDDLQRLGKEAGIKRVTDVDRALWALWRDIKDEKAPAQDKVDFENDPTILRLWRERSGLVQLFSKPTAVIAELLLKHDHRDAPSHNVAGKFGRDALEEVVDGLLYEQGYLPQKDSLKHEPFKARLDRLGGLGRFRPKIWDAWCIGCQCAHPWQNPTREEVRQLVGVVRVLKKKLR